MELDGRVILFLYVLVRQGDGMSEGAAGPVGAGGDSEATPLELIRKKESELSGRVLGAKREADEIVADARRQAVEIIDTATQESTSAARERAQALAAEAETKAAAMLTDADAEAISLADSIKSRLPAAVDHVVKAVIGA